MARTVIIHATGPIKIEPSQFPRDADGNLKAIFVCACGMTKTAPICDGSHKACRASEQPGIVYTYDPATGAVIDQRPL